MTSMRVLAEGRNNNFNLVRMLAASAVLISHAYPVALGAGAQEPLWAWLHMSLGTLAVITFFAISGFFISKSFDCRRTVIEFWVARILRIYPALTVVLLLTVFVVGPVFTQMTLTSYVSTWATFAYLPHNLSLKWLQYDLPGVFLDNPYPAAINGSLWSLFYEVACYVMVTAVGGFWVVRKTWRVPIFFCVYLVGYVLLKQINIHNSVIILRIEDLTWPFVIGMAFYHFRRNVPLNIFVVIATGAVAWASYDRSWFPEMFVLWWSYLVFYLGGMANKPLNTYNLVGDYSYGMYIYAFPCEQAVAAVWRGVSPLALAAVSFPVTLVFAVLSWHLLERRALVHRAVVAGWVESLVRSTGAPEATRVGAIRRNLSNGSKRS